MAMKNTESLANSSNQTRSVFYCPEMPEFIWDLNDTTSFKIIVAITTIACPVTVLLNLLVIIAVKTRRELKKNSNILLSSVALADLLVGAVSMPLTIASDMLFIQRILDVDIICTMYFISGYVMYIICAASFFHLLLIAWERYVAIAKWMEYKAIVTRGRVNMYTRISWLLALLLIVSSLIVEVSRLRYEGMSVIDVILSIFWLVCLLLLVYFYLRVYLAVQEWNRTRICSVNVQFKGKLERKVAYTTLGLTVFIGVSGMPIQAVYLLRGVLPFFRQASTLRWAETIFQLSSLFNPILYWYRNHPLRKATLELLRWRNRPPARTAHGIKQSRYPVAPVDVEKFHIKQKSPRFLRSESVGAMRCSDTFRQSWNEAAKERPMSAPSQIANDQVFKHQRKKQFVTVQIENAPGRKRIRRETELPKTPKSVDLPSSLNESSFMSPAIFNEIAEDCPAV